jgi:hypothetical protein
MPTPVELLQTIEAQFALIPLSVQYPSVQYRAQDFESLLDQAADHLDRGLRERNDWADLRERQIRVNSEINGHQKEQLYWASKAALIKESYGNVDNISKLVNAGGIPRIAADTRAGSMNPTYTKLASEERGYTLDIESLAAKADYVSLTANEAELKGQVTRSVEEEAAKNDIITTLEWTDRVGGIEQRYNYDLSQGYELIRVAHEGLVKFWGYDDPKPEVGTPKFYDACLIWVRRAIGFIVAKQRSDETMRVTVSLRDIMKDAFKLTGELEFSLDANLASLTWVKSLAFPRLRGVAFSVIEKQVADPIDVWRVTVKHGASISFVVPNVRARNPLVVPESAGSTVLYNLNPFTNKNTEGQYEWKWSVTAQSPSLKGRSLDKISDIWMDLIFVAQALPNQQA